jgi:hypothetical protein
MSPRRIVTTSYGRRPINPVIASASEAIHFTAEPAVKWIASSQALLAMTLRKFHLISNSEYRSAISRHDLARALHFVVPQNNEGAGNAGCALHPRSRVQNG